MRGSVQSDLERLDRLAYHRESWSGDLVRKFRRLPKATRTHPDFYRLQELYGWLLVPVTLWPFDIDGLFRAVLERIESGERLEKRLMLLLDLFPSEPSDKVQRIVAEHEHAVQHGNYEPLIRAQFKFDSIEALLAGDPQFQADWNLIKSNFDVRLFEDHKGVIRRRLVLERSMRADWAFRWHKRSDQFHAIFDVFCQRWNLYGMRGDKPLVTKLTVNLTPFGTMIFVPSYWSFDPKRDLDWKAIASLHRARTPKRQGPKLSPGAVERRKLAARVRRLWSDAATLGLKGDKRARWIIEKLGWDPRTDPRSLRKLRSVKRNKEGVSL